jgi:hypothetical protein
VRWNPNVEFPFNSCTIKAGRLAYSNTILPFYFKILYVWLSISPNQHLHKFHIRHSIFFSNGQTYNWGMQNIEQYDFCKIDFLICHFRPEINRFEGSIIVTNSKNNANKTRAHANGEGV